MTYARRCTTGHRIYQITSLTMKKEMLFADSNDMLEVFQNLHRLRDVKFSRVKIPEFTVVCDENVLIIESQFIKGHFLRSIADYNIVFDDIVLGESEYGFDSYAPHNFIVDDVGDIYAIDLDDYRYFPPKERLAKWEGAMGYWGHIVKSYRGSKQLQVEIYGEGQRQKKLKQLIEGMFNADIKRLPGNFCCKIDGKRYNTLEDAMDYLKSLYIETRNQLELEVSLPVHHRKPQKASVLFDSNNRTLVQD